MGQALGDKTKARALARECGVPIVPGTEEALTTSEQAVTFAEEAGLPIILKAAMGGGGRGMRVVHSSALPGRWMQRLPAHSLQVCVRTWPVHQVLVHLEHDELECLCSFQQTIVAAVDELEPAFKRASNEALAAFGCAGFSPHIIY